jgi:hypothetical protein
MTGLDPGPEPHGSWLGRAITHSALGYGRLHAALASRLEHTRSALEGFLWEALSLEEKSRLSLGAYGHRTTYGRLGLFPWEERWYRRDLPPVPARILVGGAGSGREIEGLLRAGYEPSGFEPVARLCATARSQLPSAVRMWTLSYEALVKAGSDSGPGMDAPYDAMLFGWGSFSHVVDPRMREQLIRVAHRLSPRGPILLSFHFDPGNGRHDSLGQRKRARQLGLKLGRLRGLPPAEARPDTLLPHAGFVHQFTGDEIEDLARLVRRTVLWGEDRHHYSHCTLLTEGTGAAQVPSDHANSQGK